MSNGKRTRAEQARINGARSKGPKTAEGRLRMAQSKLKHGLYSVNATVLRIESNEAFEFYRQAAIRRLRPRDPFELQYVEEFADITWRIARLRHAATESLNKEVHHIRVSAGVPMFPGDVVSQAEIAGSSHNGAQTALQRRISALMRDRCAVLRELRAIKNDEFLGTTQMSLKTQELPLGTTQAEPPATNPEPKEIEP